jgi:hypothetical protein
MSFIHQIGYHSPHDNRQYRQIVSLEMKSVLVDENGQLYLAGEVVEVHEAGPFAEGSHLCYQMDLNDGRAY